MWVGVSLCRRFRYASIAHHFLFPFSDKLLSSPTLYPSVGLCGVRVLTTLASLAEMEREAEERREDRSV